MKPRVLVLNTGGTLGMTPRQPDLALAPGEFSAAILEHVPEAAQIAELEASVFCNIDSSDVTPDHWVALANEIAARIGDYDGVVVTHGTDAMAYTASALSFLLLVGVTLVADGSGYHVPKGYIYFAMAFSVIVEMLNIRLRKGTRNPVDLREAYVPEKTLHQS